jgi:hypothetical protein
MQKKIECPVQSRSSVPTKLPLAQPRPRGGKKKRRKKKKIKNILLRPRKEGQKEKEIYRQPELSFKEAQLNPL